MDLYHWQDSIPEVSLPEKGAQAWQANWGHLAHGNCQEREWNTKRIRKDTEDKLHEQHIFTEMALIAIKCSMYSSIPWLQRKKVYILKQKFFLFQGGYSFEQLYLKLSQHIICKEERSGGRTTNDQPSRLVRDWVVTQDKRFSVLKPMESWVNKVSHPILKSQSTFLYIYLIFLPISPLVLV